MFSDKKSIKVKLVGSDLVAAFGSAEPALVWKLDLERNHSFTIALQGEESGWELGITSPKGEFYSVAHFPAREDAEEALLKIQKVLMKKKRSRIWCVIKFIIALLAIFVLLVFGGSYLVRHGLLNHVSITSLNRMATMPSIARPEIPPASTGEIPSGVPVTADDVLKPPSP